MSVDWLVRSARAPELLDLVEAVAAGHPGVSVRSDTSETYLVVTDADRPRVWVAPARPAFGHLEEIRLLPGATAVEGVLPWWTEITGPVEARDLVVDVARALADRLDGVADPWSADADPGA